MQSVAWFASSILKKNSFKSTRPFVFQLSRMGIAFFCVFLNRSAIGHGWRWEYFVLLLWTVVLHWSSSLTDFVSGRLCVIVFKTFSDRSAKGTLAHTHLPEFSTEENLESGTFDPSAFLPGFVRLFCFLLVRSQFASFFFSEIYFIAQFLSSNSKFQKIWGNGSAFKPRCILL